MPNSNVSQGGQKQGGRDITRGPKIPTTVCSSAPKIQRRERQQTQPVCYFLWRTLADPAAQRTHQEAALHLGQERGDQRVSRVGLLRRDRDGARVADEPRWGGARRLIPLIRIKGSLLIAPPPPVCPTCRNQPGPGGQRALSLSHLQPQRRHHRQRERVAGGEVWRWVWPSYAAVVDKLQCTLQTSFFYYVDLKCVWLDPNTFVCLCVVCEIAHYIPLIGCIGLCNRWSTRLIFIHSFDLCPKNERIKKKKEIEKDHSI